MISQSRRTSFFALTAPPSSESDDVMERVEIPQFQRDYAQGRDSDAVGHIRTEFLDALHGALAGSDPTPVGLDFVYGGIDDGTFRPLDGQQRLTTLFLLHWYIASRSGQLAADHGWRRFSYATRMSARMFCERLASEPLPNDADEPSAWIKDQPWYLFLWRHDPTIQSMLVMIDAIHHRFCDINAGTAWERLTDVDDPAVWFLHLRLDGLGSERDEATGPEDLYIKMNSRGKPLTEFENFKADFEQTIESSDRSAEFERKVDTTWSDLLWDLRGDDDLIDDEFLRYMQFVTEVCEWRDGRVDGADRRLNLRTRDVFEEQNPARDDHLDFLFEAFDIWTAPERSIQATFQELFTPEAGDGSRVRLFFRGDADQPGAVDLFDACCRSYGENQGRSRARVFSLGQTVLLYAVLRHLIESNSDFPVRVRTLRNLVEASADQLRATDMPKLLADVDHLVRHGDVRSGTTTFNRAAAADEERKAAFLREHPLLQLPLFALEDQPLLRGNLGAFELDATTFEHRAAIVTELMSRPDLWTDLLGALLAVGEYQRQPTDSKRCLFGTDSTKHQRAWRDLLTGASRDALAATRQVLAELLDLIAATDGDLGDVLQQIRSNYLKRCDAEKRFDWRYYMVKYPSMRAQGSSTYVGERDPETGQREMGYSLCMLKPGKSQLNSRYRDPYLLAIAREFDDVDLVDDPWFTGWEGHPRWLRLTRTGAGLRSSATGFELSPPPTDEHSAGFATVCASLGVGNGERGWRFVVPQLMVDNRMVDMADRIQLGADIVRRMADAEL